MYVSHSLGIHGKLDAATAILDAGWRHGARTRSGTTEGHRGSRIRACECLECGV